MLASQVAGAAEACSSRLAAPSPHKSSHPPELHFGCSRLHLKLCRRRRKAQVIALLWIHRGCHALRHRPVAPVAGEQQGEPSNHGCQAGEGRRSDENLSSEIFRGDSVHTCNGKRA